MRIIPTFLLATAVAAVPATAAGLPQDGDQDDQVIISGCVMRAGEDNSSGPRSLLVWSDGDVYFDDDTTTVELSHPASIVTAGIRQTVFYWIDDEDDFSTHAGQHVTVVGELSDDLDEGEIEIDREGDVTEIEVEVDGHETTARVPTAWLGAHGDAEVDIIVRRVDVEEVKVVGPCSRY